MSESVSVVIPVYNGAAYLDECVRSVLAQTKRVSQIIVVDDGSTDETPAVAARLRDSIHYIHQENGGISSARNTACKVARGEFICFLDCDDVWAPRKVEWQIDALSRQRDAAMVFGYAQQFVSSELSAEEKGRFKVNAEPMPGWIATTLLLRNEDFRRVGEFNTQLHVGEFVEWFARARDLDIRPIMLAQTVALRRIHLGNIGTRRRDRRVDYARALKAALDRRRQRA